MASWGPGEWAESPDACMHAGSLLHAGCFVVFVCFCWGLFVLCLFCCLSLHLYLLCLLIFMLVYFVSAAPSLSCLLVVCICCLFFFLLSPRCLLFSLLLAVYLSAVCINIYFFCLHKQRQKHAARSVCTPHGDSSLHALFGFFYQWLSITLSTGAPT